MLVPGAANPLLMAAAATASAYRIARSLRFNSVDSAYLSKTFGVVGNDQKWTLSIWLKPSVFGTVRKMFTGGAGGDDANFFQVQFGSGDTLTCQGWSTTYLTTTQVFRDPTAWGNLVVAVDTTNATANNRIRVYWQGAEITSFSTRNNPSLNAHLGVMKAALHTFGTEQPVFSSGYNGYLAETILVDGQQLTSSSFGATDATTGAWNPKSFSGGAYGTNGFKLNFSDNSNTTAATLGADTSGNGNNWTPNNFSVAAGVGNDSLTDTPTNYGTDTGLGGEVHGNYCTLNVANPVIGSVAITNGGLTANFPSSPGSALAVGTQIMQDPSSYEMTVSAQSFSIIAGIGNGDLATGVINTPNAYYYGSSGNKVHQDWTGTGYGAAYTAGDTIKVSYSGGVLTFYKNGVSQGAAFSGLSGTFFPLIWSDGSTSDFNFGQRAYATAAPGSAKCLCTQNISTPSIVKSTTGFGIDTSTGTGATRTVASLSFQPDLVWIKSRSAATDHNLFDSQRLATKGMATNATTAEYTTADTLTAFTGSGFTVGADATPKGVNVNAATYVNWCWRKGATYGFDIVLYTGDGTSPRAISHALGVTPGSVIVKIRSGANGWFTWHKQLPGGSDYFEMQSAGGVSTSSAVFASAPSSTVFNVGGNGGVNGAASTYVTYLWAEVAGFSAMRSFTGNSGADGPFVNTGFRPAFVFFKAGAAGLQWYTYDAARNLYNVADAALAMESAQAELASGAVDFCAQGMKVRSGSGNINNSGAMYVWLFAEAAGKYSRAR